MARISAEEIANEVGLAADELSKPCDSDIISSLADCFCQWKVIFGSLLSELDLNDINKENLTEEEKRIAALRKWKARNGSKGTYKILVDALLNRGERDQAESLCKILANYLSCNKNKTTATDCDAKENETVIRFQCPCGKCLLETYLKDGCPKSCIPYLGMTTLSKGDQENLNYILKKDTKKIMESFINLSNRTCDSLIRQEVTVDRLVRVAVTSNSSLHDKLTGSTSIDQVFTHLAPEMSFFNHKTLAKIIEELGHPDDKDRLADYSKEFKEFCKRKIFEIEPGHCTCGQRFSQLKQRKLFAVVLPAGEETLHNLGDAVSMKEMLADDLDIPLDSLHLHRIDRGSIILVFSVPDSIACDLFPLPKEKLALLTKKGIVLFVPQDMKSETNQVKDNVSKPMTRNADMHESSSKCTPIVPSGAPGELYVSHSLPTSAQLSWTPVPENKQNDAIIGYTIQIEGPNFTQEIPVMDKNAACYEISDLRPYTTYTFSVSAMTEAGIGPAICVSSATPERGLISDPPLRLSRSLSHPGPSLKLSSNYLFKYKGEQNRAENVVGDLDKFINEISKHIGMQWMFLARSLGFEQTDIDAIEYRDQRNLREQIFQMFHEWKRREGSEATTDRLLAAVKDAELKELMKTLKEKGFIVSSSRGSADVASALAAGVRYPVQVTDDAQRDSPAELKTTAKSTAAPVPLLGAQAAQGQGQGGATPPSERDHIRQKRLQRFTSDTSDTNPTQGAVSVVERTTSSGSVQSPVLSPSAAATSSIADIPAESPGFEIGDMIQVDRPDSAPWYGVIRWIGTLPGRNNLFAGLEMESKVLGGGPGSWQGITYFSCSDGHGLFLPPSHLKRDNRFAEVDANTTSEAPPTTSSDQDSKSSQPGRSASATEDRLKDLFTAFGMQDDAGDKQSDSEETGPKAFELQIPADQAGLVIGTQGKNIREVERLTNTSIKVDRGSGLLGGENRRVLVVGSEENCKKALLIILKNLKRRVDEHTAGARTISVPNSCVGRIIGKGGATINTIKSISGAQDIKFDDRKTGLEAMLQTERKCYIHGSEEAMEKAEKLIRLAMTGEDIVAGATFAAIFMELLKMGVQCQEDKS